MLINKIREAMNEARKGNDAIRKNLLVTLFSESQMVGKNKANRESTDDEVVATIKKFVNNTEETLKFMKERNVDSGNQQHELEILQEFLPKQLSEQELREEIKAIIESLSEKSPKMMGAVMAGLKAKHGANYDGKLASALVKTELT
jgi:hypothetical protein